MPRTAAALVVLVALIAGLALHPTQAQATPAAQQTFGGTLQKLVADGPNGRSHTYYQLRIRGKEIALVGGKLRQLRLHAGQSVKISGTPVAGGLTVDSVVSASPALAVPPQTTGNISVAVVLINFANDRSTPWTPAQAQSTVSTGLNAFYGEASNGQTSFTVSSFGWYQLSATNTACDSQAWKTEAVFVAQTAGVNLASYSHVMLVFPENSACNWAGLGEMPGAVTWINDATLDVRVTAHEMGHNLGLSHASAWICPAGSMIGNGCASLEYKDPFDAMGDGFSGVYEFSSWRKAQLGWLHPGEQQTLVASGDYSIAADEAARDSGVKLLRVPLADGSYYAVETRTQTGQYDSLIDPLTTSGVLIRLVPGSFTDLTKQTNLLDGNPGTATFSDAAFQLGECLSDPANNLSITTLRASGGTALVHVSLGTATCAIVNTAAPSLSSTGSVSAPSPSQTLSTNSGSWAGSPSSYSYTWRRDGTGTIVGATSASYTITSGDLGHTLSVIVTAANAGGSSSVTTTTTGVVLAAPANTTVPSLSSSGSLSAPSLGETLSASTGSWGGSPAAFSYSWQRDGTPVAGASAASYTIGSGDLGHRLSVTVTATNARGSASASSIATGVALAAPSIISPAMVSGTAQVGQTLSASAQFGGGALTIGYVWARAVGGGWVTVGALQNYTAVGSDLGAVLRVTVTATNGRGTITSQASSTAVTAAPVVVPPSGGGGGGGGGSSQIPPQISLNVAASTASVDLGGQVGYTISVFSKNAGTATNMHLTVALPAAATMALGTSTRGSGCTQNGQMIDCNLDWLSPPLVAQVQLVVSFASAGAFMIPFAVSEQQTDADPSDNQTTAALTVNDPNTHVVVPPIVTTGGTGSPAKLTVAVSGTAKVGVTLHATLPAALRKAHTISYRWQDFRLVKSGTRTSMRWTSLSGASHATLKIGSSLAGRKLRLLVTVSGKTYMSPATAPVRKR